MTIPRIGNKIPRISKKSTTPDQTEQNSSQGAASSQESKEYDKTNNVEDNKNISKKNEHEYSIEKFTEEYLDKLHKDVLPLLTQYEPERKQKLILAIICSSACWISALSLLSVNGNISDLVAALIALGGFLWFLIKKNFEKKVKKTVMPILMQAVPNFYWQLSPSIPEEDIIESKIFPLAKESSKTYDDTFLGQYRNVNISIAECSLKANKRNVFSGVIIRIKMNKDFEGMTIIRPKKDVDVSNVNDLKKAKLQKVELEDVEFNKTYDVYSTDQIEARYLLTTSFMERFRSINMAFDTKVSYCSFCGKYVYIAPYCKKDLFSICSLIKRVDDEAQFVKLFSEFISILELVDHFKLDRKLGL